MKCVELSAGPVEYDDTGGDGPVLVFLHGVLMDGRLWRDVVTQLAPRARCVLPTLPLGAHRKPMHSDAELGMHGMARLVAEFIEALELTDVTLLTNDWGGPQVMVADGLTGRVSRLVLTSCEAFDNYPPGLPGRMLHTTARLPGGLLVAAKSLAIRPLRRTPTTFGWMCKRPVPDELMNEWSSGARSSKQIRHDLRKYVLGVPGRDELLQLAERMRDFTGPTLVVWAAEDRVMPPEHGRRLAEMIPNARYHEIADSYTMLPQDQPAELGRLIGEFLDSTAA